jgi:hypothetical protein
VGHDAGSLGLLLVGVVVRGGVSRQSEMTCFHGSGRGASQHTEVLGYVARLDELAGDGGGVNGFLGVRISEVEYVVVDGGQVLVGLV